MRILMRINEYRQPLETGKCKLNLKMSNSRYTLVIIIRAILITLNSFVLIWLYTQTNRPATTFFILILLATQTAWLIVYLNRINRDLANFIAFLQENDTTLAFTKGRVQRNFGGLSYQLQNINERLRTAGIEKERQYQYFQAIVKQIDTGIIAFDQDGKIELCNHAAEEILGIHSVHNFKDIRDRYPELSGFFEERAGNPVLPVRIHAKGKEQVLAVKTGSIKFENKLIRLITLQNIKPELEAGELDAWRRLIRIQRHEIMNSITPITTLTTAIKRRFKREGVIKGISEISDEQITDALLSVDVIEDRSLGLIDFMERFKDLTEIPVLKAEVFPFKRILDRVLVLFSKEISLANIFLKISLIPEDILVYGDEKLLEQVLINLVKNSIEALSAKYGEITINAFVNIQNKSVIQVTDNGTGMDKDTMENIFIPAFTTKEKGSGIGLSIIRQIVQLHRGSIEVRSDPGVKTLFEMVLPEKPKPVHEK
jgi:two-component system, NtrC family, nitrogen regulation sensor histidine kinase NtrY